MRELIKAKMSWFLGIAKEVASKAASFVSGIVAAHGTAKTIGFGILTATAAYKIGKFIYEKVSMLWKGTRRKNRLLINRCQFAKGPFATEQDKKDWKNDVEKVHDLMKKREERKEEVKKEKKKAKKEKKDKKKEKLEKMYGEEEELYLIDQINNKESEGYDEFLDPDSSTFRRIVYKYKDAFATNRLYEIEAIADVDAIDTEYVQGMTIPEARKMAYSYMYPEHKENLHAAETELKRYTRHPEAAPTELIDYCTQYWAILDQILIGCELGAFDTDENMEKFNAAMEKHLARLQKKGSGFVRFDLNRKKRSNRENNVVYAF